jgi:hypothetical protein
MAATTVNTVKASVNPSIEGVRVRPAVALWPSPITMTAGESAAAVGLDVNRIGDEADQCGGR